MNKKYQVSINDVPFPQLPPPPEIVPDEAGDANGAKNSEDPNSEK